MLSDFLNNVFSPKIPTVELPTTSEKDLTIIDRSIEESKSAAGNAVSIIKKLVPQVDAFLSEAEKQKQWEEILK